MPNRCQRNADIRFRFFRSAIIPGAFLVCLPALAHPGHGLQSLSAGLAHPLSGPDHLLTALAVGLLAARPDGRMDLRPPAVFLVAMILGAGLGRVGLTLPFCEPCIALSLALGGGALAFGRRASLSASALWIAAFGVFHGNAHAREVGGGELGVSALLGLVLATAGLHAIGIGLGRAIREAWSEDRARWVFRGVGVGLAGAVFIVL